jgi:hypothetical protein
MKTVDDALNATSMLEMLYSYNYVVEVSRCRRTNAEQSKRSFLERSNLTDSPPNPIEVQEKVQKQGKT